MAEVAEVGAEGDASKPNLEPEVIEDGPAAPTSGEPGDFGTVAALEGGSGVRVATICTNCNQASLTVNGVTGSDHIQVSFDGIPAIGGLGTVYALTQFPADMVGYTHVERGPGSVLSGSGGMGGTIEFHSAKRTTEQRSFMRLEAGDWATHSLKLAGADRWGPVGALVFVQSTNQNNIDANRDGANEVAEFERYTYQGIFDFHLTDRQVLNLHYVNYGEDQFAGPGRPQRPTNDFADEDVFFNWHQYGVDWEWAGDDGSTVTFRSSRSRRFQQQVSEVLPGQPPIDYLHVRDERQYADLRGTIPIGAGMLTAGATWSRTNIEWLNEEALDERFVDDGLSQTSLYVQYDRSLGSHWQVGAGLRLDDAIIFGKSRSFEDQPWTVSPDDRTTKGLPRLDLHWRPNAIVSVGLATGSFLVGPIPAAEKTCCGAQIERTVETATREGVDYETSWSSQLAVEVHPTQDMRLTTTMFRTDFDDYIQRVVRKSTFGVPTYGLDNVEEARVQGFDVVHDMRFKGNLWNVGWTYAWTSSEDQDGHDLPYLARRNASGYVRYDLAPRGIKVSFDARWTGPIRHYQLSAEPRPNRPPVGFRESEDFVTADVSYEQRIGKKGWYVQAGVANLTDYVMSDLDRVDKNDNDVDDIYERCFDWGPITGRYGWVAVKWSR